MASATKAKAKKDAVKNPAAKQAATKTSASKKSAAPFQQEPLCFLNLGKSLGVGDGPQTLFCVDGVGLRPPCAKPGPDGPCQTFVVNAHMTTPVVSDVADFGKDPLGTTPTEPCDSKAAQALNGGLTFTPLVMRFKLAKKGPKDKTFPWVLRGIHDGRFKWTGKGGVTASGTVAGVNSIGIFRTPAMPAVSVDGTALKNGLGERCNEPMLHGLMNGTISAPLNHPLSGASIRAIYRISYDPGPDNQTGCGGKLGSKGRGVIQGVIIPIC